MAAMARAPLPCRTSPAASGFTIGQTAGTETVTLTVQQIPLHTHAPVALTGAGTNASPANGVWAESSLNPYSATAPTVLLNSVAVGQAGGSQPHDNMIPILAINFIISLFGVFPSQI